MFRILEPFFHALSDGKIIRLTVAWVLRVVAVLGAIGGLAWFFVVLIFGFKAYDNQYLGTRSGGLLFGCILLALFGLAIGYLWAGIGFFRARTIIELRDGHFTVLPILSILFRMNGELVFVTYSLIGVGGCLFVWFTDANPFAFGPLSGELPVPALAGTGFLGGIELAVIMLLIGFIGIVISYAMAEFSIVLIEIAANTGKTAAMSAQSNSATLTIAPVPAPAPPSAQVAPGVPLASTCRHCGQPIDTGAAFCAECGKAVI